MYFLTVFGSCVIFHYMNLIPFPMAFRLCLAFSHCKQSHRGYLSFSISATVYDFLEINP